jgi:hypothetical protein
MLEKAAREAPHNVVRLLEARAGKSIVTPTRLGWHTTHLVTVRSQHFPIILDGSICVWFYFLLRVFRTISFSGFCPGWRRNVDAIKYRPWALKSTANQVSARRLHGRQNK